MDKENKNATALTALIEENMPEKKEVKFGEDENEFIVKVSQAIGIGIKAEAIQTAVDLLFQDDSTDMNSFMPALTKFAQRFGILLAYTNFEIPSEIDKAWLAVMYTPIYDEVAARLGESVIDNFVDDFNRLLDAKILEIAYATNWNRLLDRMGGMLGRLTENLGDFDIEKAFGMLSGLGKNFDIGSLMKTLSGEAESEEG